MVLRVTKEENPSDDDFVPHLVLYPDRRDVRTKPCQAAGLSVYRVLGDIERLKRRVPAIAKCKGIAQAELDASLGKLLHTPKDSNSHHTWWVPDAVQPRSHFERLEAKGSQHG